MDNRSFHKPVMAEEAVGFLGLKNGSKVLDATVGCGAHAQLILKKISPDGFLVGVDRDEKSLEIARETLREFDKERYKLMHGNFRDVDSILRQCGIGKIDAALFDLGVSSYQLEDASRGFSFARGGALDMRMDLSQENCAHEVVNKSSRTDLEKIIREFGQERYYRRVVDFILKKRPINSTLELSAIIKKAVGSRYRFQRIHPATRVFQALRIAVNDELASLDEALAKLVNFLKVGARVCVISFHSLEDRIVKLKFREFKNRKMAILITKKPLQPTDREKHENPRSRSAKFRVLERI